MARRVSASVLLRHSFGPQAPRILEACQLRSTTKAVKGIPMPAPLWRSHMSKFALLVTCSVAIAAQGCSTRAPDGESALPNGPTAPSRVGADSERLVEIDRVRVYMKDGRLQAFVEGTLGDGCTSLKAVTQTRAGNEVRIRLTSVRVGEVCTMILAYLKRLVPLEGIFPPGSYTVRANQRSSRFQLVVDPSGNVAIEPDPGPLPEIDGVPSPQPPLRLR